MLYEDLIVSFNIFLNENALLLLCLFIFIIFIILLLLMYHHNKTSAKNLNTETNSNKKFVKIIFKIRTNEPILVSVARNQKINKQQAIEIIQNSSLK